MTQDIQAPAPPAEPGDPPGLNVGKKRGRRLHSIANVKACLADVVRELEADRMDVQKARALVYALATLAGIIQGHDMEQRIKQLEART